MSKILSIVIPVFNKYNFTKACLNDLSKLPSDHEIIIIDNGSSDETQSELQGSKEIVYKRNEVNQGFAKACNKGYGYASANNILFLNNDIRVKSDYDSWTQPLIEKCSEGLVGPTMGLLNSDLSYNCEYHCGQEFKGNPLPLDLNDLKYIEVFHFIEVLKKENLKFNIKTNYFPYLSGWCIASSKENWNKLDISGNKQIFSEEFFCYFEDTDLSFRANELGIKMNLAAIPVIHFARTSSKQLDVQDLYLKARQIFIKKWDKHIKK